MRRPSSPSLPVAVLLGLVVGASAAACGPRGGTDVGNGAQVTFDLKGYESAPPASGAQSITLASGAKVHAVWLAVERFELLPGEACGGSNKADDDGVVTGAFVADLLDTGIAGARPEIRVPAGPYCRLRLELHDVDAEELPAGAPGELAGAAVLVEGERADGVPFVVRSKRGVEFRLDAKAGSFEVGTGAEPFIVGFELGSLIDALALDELSGPSITIDSENNPEVLADFDRALRTAARLFRDQNDDGELDLDEHDEDDELAVGDDS